MLYVGFRGWSAIAVVMCFFSLTVELRADNPSPKSQENEQLRDEEILRRAEDLRSTTAAAEHKYDLISGTFIWGVPVLSAILTVLTGVKALLDHQTQPSNATPSGNPPDTTGNTAARAGRTNLVLALTSGSAPLIIAIFLLGLSAMITLLTTINSTVQPGQQYARSVSFTSRLERFLHEFKIQKILFEKALNDAKDRSVDKMANMERWYDFKQRELDDIHDAWRAGGKVPSSPEPPVPG